MPWTVSRCSQYLPTKKLGHYLRLKLSAQAHYEIASEFNSSIMKDVSEILRSTICFCLLICSCDAYFWAAKQRNKDANSDICATGDCNTLRVSSSHKSRVGIRSQLHDKMMVITHAINFFLILAHCLRQWKF